MRRATIALGVVVILASSCGQSDLPPGFAAALQEQVDSVRQLAEAGRPGLARDELEALVALVTSRLERDLMDEGRALDILESAEAVEAQLSLLPRASATEAPSPPPVEEEEGDGDSGKDKGKGNGNGNGGEGHGND